MRFFDDLAGRCTLGDMQPGSRAGLNPHIVPQTKNYRSTREIFREQKKAETRMNTTFLPLHNDRKIMCLKRAKYASIHYI